MMKNSKAEGRPNSETGLAGAQVPHLTGMGPADDCGQTIHIPGRDRREPVPAQLGSRSEPARPLSVPGPLGQPITLDTLPPAETRRWVVRRKAEVIAAIRGGLLTAAEACARYRLSPEELELWQDCLDRAGVPGLRVTRIQLYRDYPVKPVAKPAAPATVPKTDLSRSWGL